VEQLCSYICPIYSHILFSIVRDFTTAAHTRAKLQQLQRNFVTALIDNFESRSTLDAGYVYMSSNLKHHLMMALTSPFASDKLAKRALLHEGA
jgi:hypothetical protein